MQPNRITICRYEFDNEAAFRKSIGDAVNLLLDNDYTINAYYDDKGLGVVCIDFDHKDEELASLYPYWLDLDEADAVDAMRIDKRMAETCNG